MDKSLCEAREAGGPGPQGPWNRGQDSALIRWAPVVSPSSVCSAARGFDLGSTLTLGLSPGPLEMGPHSVCRTSVSEEVRPTGPGGSECRETGISQDTPSLCSGQCPVSAK